MKRLLLDTSVIIDHLHKRDAKNTLLYSLVEEELYVSIVTYTEVFSGKSIWESDEVKTKVEELFLALKILPLSTKISEKAGYIKAHYAGGSIADSIIAATAVENGLELVTLNRKHFVNVEGVKFLDL